MPQPQHERAAGALVGVEPLGHLLGLGEVGLSAPQGHLADPDALGQMPGVVDHDLGADVALQAAAGSGDLVLLVLGLG